MAQHSIAVLKIAVELHEANGDEPVEPSVGQRFHRLAEPVSIKSIEQLLSLSDNRCGEGSACDDCHIALLRDRLNLRGRDPVERSTIRYRLNKITACPPRAILEDGEVQ